MSLFRKATKDEAKLRLALFGPSGSGKTYSALRIAQHLVDDPKIAVLDTEHGSASKYADEFDFDVAEIDEFDPRTFVNIIEGAVKDGYNILIIDSASHAWMGKGGVLEIKDKAEKKYSGNSYAAWGDATPVHNQFIEGIIRADIHLIVTMRAKTDYVLEEYSAGDGKTKTRPKKVGLAPIQRDGMEYEFDVVGMLDMDNNLIIEKTRCSALNGEVIEKPGENIATTIRDWLSGESVTDDDRARLEALGTEIYNGKWEEKRPQLIDWASNSRVTLLTGLRKSEYIKLVDGLEAKKAQLEPAGDGQ